MNPIISTEDVQHLIYIIRGQRVMLSTHLADLYGVEPRALIQSVKRNMDRFPADFMFQLTDQEFKNLKSQIVISSWGGLRRATPYAFTEQGVAMLSSVLKGKQAAQVVIMIMRTFVKIRQMVSLNRALAKRLAAIERTLSGHGADILNIYKIIQDWPQPTEKGQIGFKGSK